MNNFKDIKKRLSSSTTMPLGTGGGNDWLLQNIMGGHVHNADGSCCGHDHHHHHHDHHHHDGCCDDEEDTTNPSGGCC